MTKNHIVRQEAAATRRLLYTLSCNRYNTYHVFWCSSCGTLIGTGKKVANDRSAGEIRYFDPNISGKRSTHWAKSRWKGKFDSSIRSTFLNHSHKEPHSTNTFVSVIAKKIPVGRTGSYRLKKLKGSVGWTRSVIRKNSHVGRTLSYRW